MEKLWHWLSRTPSPDRNADSVRASPAKPLPPGLARHSNSYPLRSHEDSVVHQRMPDGSLRKRLVRTPGVSHRVPAVRRTLLTEFASASQPVTPQRAPGVSAASGPSVSIGADHKHSPQREATHPRRLEPRRERKYSETPPPALLPVEGWCPRPATASGHVPVSLRPFLAPDTLSRSDFSVLRAALLRQADVLAPRDLDAFAQALAQRVMRASPSASRGMLQLVDHLLSPLELRLPHDLLGALTHGLAQACVELAKADRPPGTPRGLAMARDHLSRHVAQVAAQVGDVRHAVQACALARIAGPGEARLGVSTPRELGRLMAINPATALWYPDARLGDVERLCLFNAALSMPPGVSSEGQATQLRNQLLDRAPARLRGKALANLMRAASHHVRPASWPARRFGTPVFLDMLDYRLREGVRQWIDAADRAVREEEDPAVSPIADRALQGRQARALGEVVQGLLSFFMGFDASQDPQFLRQWVIWLRAQAAPGSQPEVAVVASAAADALEGWAQALSAHPSPARL